MQANEVESEFARALAGRLHGVLRWQQWDALCGSMRAAGPWYFYDLAQAPPCRPLAAESFDRALDRLDRLLRREHGEDYCGLAYADDLRRPRLVKVYHPRRLGSVCGTIGAPVLPGWVLSVWPPTELSLPPPPPPSAWRRWLGRL